MKRALFVCSFLFLSPFLALQAQEVDNSDLNRQLREREERVNQLPLEVQLKVRAAQVKAAEDPAVQAAMKKRDQALREFRAAVRASMIKTDPSLAPVLEQIAIKD